MPRARDILSAARAATVWLLMVVSMFLGPASVFAAGPDACGDACPCEEAEQDDHHVEDDCADEHCADEHCADESEHDTPPGEGCPEDCPGCHASPGVALASFECSLPPSPLSSSSPDLMPRDAAAIGVCSGVFRPPRSR